MLFSFSLCVAAMSMKPKKKKKDVCKRYMFMCIYRLCVVAYVDYDCSTNNIILHIYSGMLMMMMNKHV